MPLLSIFISGYYLITNFGSFCFLFKDNISRIFFNLQAAGCNLLIIYKGSTPCNIKKIPEIPVRRRIFIYRTINQYNGTGEVLDRPKSGLLISIATTWIKKLIRSRISRDSRKSLRKISSKLGISRSSVTKFVKRDLGRNKVG